MLIHLHNRKNRPSYMPMYVRYATVMLNIYQEMAL